MEPNYHKPMIGIIGGHSSNTNPQALSLAEKTGEQLAKLGITVVCGGEDGIMEAVCKGAKRHNGTTIAITKSNKKEDANKYFDGRFGTICEIGLILDIGRPLVLLGKHELINSEMIDVHDFAHFEEYSDENIQKAIDFVIQRIHKKIS